MSSPWLLSWLSPSMSSPWLLSPSASFQLSWPSPFYVLLVSPSSVSLPSSPCRLSLWHCVPSSYFSPCTSFLSLTSPCFSFPPFQPSPCTSSPWTSSPSPWPFSLSASSPSSLPSPSSLKLSPSSSFQQPFCASHSHQGQGSSGGDIYGECSSAWTCGHTHGSKKLGH